MTEILLVASDVVTGTPIADELGSAGYDVMWCRGPSKPGFVCAAGKRGRCPITSSAEVAVVDGWLASDEQRAGIPSWSVAAYYRQHGIPVVALVGPNGFPFGGSDTGLIRLPRDAALDEIVTAVKLLAAVNADPTLRLRSRIA
jgi:hypothetical protein